MIQTFFRPVTLLLLALLVWVAPAQAHSYKLGDLTIGHPWARATAGTAANGAAYLLLSNSGASADQLLSADCPQATRTELHTHLMEEGVMKMRQLQGVDIDPGAPLEFKPGGLHVMLIGLKAPLKEGTRVPLTLTFAKAGTITVEIAVESVGSTGHDGMKPPPEHQH